MMVARSLLLLWLVQSSARALIAPCAPDATARDTNRREILACGVASLFGILTGTSFPDSTFAFENKISTQYDDRPKRRGAKVGRQG